MLYDVLLRLAPPPVATLSRTAAVAMHHPSTDTGGCVFTQAAATRHQPTQTRSSMRPTCANADTSTQLAKFTRSGRSTTTP
jgi:predicted RNA polymerase sigma factor